MRMPTVLWLDGCFDGFHYAHANAVRQALTLVPGPTRILVAVHSDSDITRHKGPPLFNEQERYALIAGCRWINEIIRGVPYVTQLGLLQKFDVDFVVHGDDPAQDASGNDCYAIAKSQGKYKEFKRTPGISTTSLIERILDPDVPRQDQAPLRGLLDAFVRSISPSPPIIDFTHLDNYELPAFESTNTVYIGGSWDNFGAGHVEYLRRAKESSCLLNGTEKLLVVGIWSDETVEALTGERPLLMLLERALALVQCRYTDGLILNAATVIPASLPVCDSLGVGFVVNEHSTVAELGQSPADGSIQCHRSIHVVMPKLQTLTNLRKSVFANKEAFQKRQQRKGGL